MWRTGAVSASWARPRGHDRWSARRAPFGPTALALGREACGRPHRPPSRPPRPCPAAPAARAIARYAVEGLARLRLVTQKGDARFSLPVSSTRTCTGWPSRSASSRRSGFAVYPKRHLLGQLLLGSRLRCISSHAVAIGHGVRSMIQRLPARTEQRARLLGHRRLKFTHASVRRQPARQQLLCRRSPRWITKEAATSCTALTCSCTRSVAACRRCST